MWHIEDEGHDEHPHPHEDLPFFLLFTIFMIIAKIIPKITMLIKIVAIIISSFSYAPMDTFPSKEFFFFSGLNNIYRRNAINITAIITPNIFALLVNIEPI